MGIFSFKKKKLDEDGNELVVDVITIDGASSEYEYDSVSEMYDNCPYIRAIIDYKASALANGKFKMYKYVENGEDEEIKNHKALNLLNFPNPLQSGQSLIAQTLIYETLYSNSYIRAVKGLSNEFVNAKALWSLPPEAVEPEYKSIYDNDIYNKFQLDDIIEYYKFTTATGINKLYNNEILYSHNYALDFKLEVSEFETLRQSVANLMYIQQSRGVLIRNRGALGMLSPAASNRDAGGVIPLEKPDKDNVLKSYKKLYGLKPSQSSVVIPDVPMTWQAMTANIKDLQLAEQSLEEFNICCDLLGVPRGIFDDKTSYANQNEIKKRLYQDSIIPYANYKANLFTQKFGLKGEYIVIDYSHIEALQEDEKLKAETESMKTGYLETQFKSGIISLGRYKKEVGEEPKATDYNIYYEQSERV